MNTKAAIAGVGYTEFSRDSGRSRLSRATVASRNALDDAGLTATEVERVASIMVMNNSVHCQAVATSLAVPQLRYVLVADLGGQAPCYLTGMAALAIQTGHA